jgi:hypothetical protein
VTYYYDDNGGLVDLAAERASSDPEPERHTPTVDHRGDVWQDPAGWYVAACDCGWSKITWSSVRAASDLLRRHREGHDQ